jgi:putative ATPase
MGHLEYCTPECLSLIDVLRYDRAGEEHFNIISALHKSIRNSDADAGLYWLARMIEAGEDPLYVARRLVRFASEDVGLADPQALVVAMAAQQAVHFIGLPEGALALAELAVYLAAAPKSNAVYRAYGDAVADALTTRAEPPPLQIRNAPTGLMKTLGYGAGYRYAHDEEEGVAAMECLPDGLRGRRYYRPTERGAESDLGRRLEAARLVRERARDPGKD